MKSVRIRCPISFILPVTKPGSNWKLPLKTPEDDDDKEKQEVTASVAAAKKISTKLVTVLTELGGILTLKEERRTALALARV